MNAGLGGLHGIVLVMRRRGRAGQIVNLVNLHIQRKGNVVTHQLEMRIVQQAQDVVLVAGEKVVDAKDVVSGRQQPFAEMRTQKTRSAGYHHSFSRIHRRYKVAFRVIIAITPIPWAKPTSKGRGKKISARGSFTGRGGDCRGCAAQTVELWAFRFKDDLSARIIYPCQRAYPGARTKCVADDLRRACRSG